MKVCKKLIIGSLLVIANSANATLFTFTSTGKIDNYPFTMNGYDGWGIFGTSGRYLDGLPFSVSVSYMLGDDVTHVPDKFTGASGPMPFAYSATVDGHTYTSSAQPTYDLSTNAAIANSQSMGNGWYDIVDSRTVGVDGASRGVAILQYIQQTVPFVGSSSSLQQFFTYTSRTSPAVTSFVQFSLQNGNGATNFFSHGPITITINGKPVSTVPEPASLFLFASGLLALTVAYGRRARVE
jgi:hypothetical protein